ncbi:MAG: putative transporter [Methanocella sp. PtaU1.Bin125]|nr:MAG: putative transporter [Methanocella sp. PtaU1.Bin125]
MEIIKSYIRALSGFNGNVRLLLLRTIVMGLYAGIYGIIFNLYILDMGYRADFLGLLLSVTLLTSSAVSIPAGLLCDRFDRRKLMLVSSALSVAAVVPIFVLHSPYALVLFSALYGVFSSISAVCLTPVLADNCDQETVHVFSANASLGWIASVAGCALGGILPGLWKSYMASGNSYRLTLLSSLALLAVSCILIALMKAARSLPVRTARKRKPFSLKDLRPSGMVLKFTLTSLTFGVASGMIVPYFNIYFMKVVNMGVLEIGLTSAAAGAFMLVGFILTPYIASKIGKVRSAVVSKLLAAPFLVLMALTTDFVLVAGAYVAYMFLINMAGPATTSFQMEQIRPHEQGYAVGLMSTGSCLAVSASSFISGLLIAGGNFLVPFLLTCAGYVVTAVLLYYYFKDVEPIPGRRRTSTPIPEIAPAIFVKSLAGKSIPGTRAFSGEHRDGGRLFMEP